MYYCVDESTELLRYNNVKKSSLGILSETITRKKVLTLRLCDDERVAAEAAAAATDLDEVFGIGDDVDGGDDDGEPVRCLRRANALLSPSVLSCILCTFTNQWLVAILCWC